MITLRSFIRPQWTRNYVRNRLCGSRPSEAMAFRRAAEESSEPPRVGSYRYRRARTIDQTTPVSKRWAIVACPFGTAVAFRPKINHLKPRKDSHEGREGRKGLLIRLRVLCAPLLLPQSRRDDRK